MTTTDPAGPVRGSFATEQFREVMSAVCTPVTVATATVGDMPHGTTVSAFASLSLVPPMVTLALDRDSDLLRIALASGRVGINVLSHAQDDVALRFARKGADKFAGVPWTLDDGLPRLRVALGWLACDVDEAVEGGDHVVLLCGVRAAAAGAEAPLVYHRRRFGTHSGFVSAVPEGDRDA